MAKIVKNKRIHLLAEGKIDTALFKLSAPAIAGMLVMAIYNVADTFFVSLLRDTTAVAATGIVFPIFQLIGSIGLTFGIGAASVISRKLGENNYEEASKTAATALLSAITVGILFSLFGAIFIKPILVFFGATETILNAATLYGRIIVGGSVFQVSNMCLNNLLRSEGASLHSSTGQILGAVINMILDPVLIFVFHMGISGAAIATIFSQFVSTLFLSSYYLRKKGVINPFSFSYFHPSKTTYKNIMILGVPTFVRQILGSISLGILNNVTKPYGDNAIAAISVSFRLFSLFMMGLTGLGQGLQPLVGYNYGAKKIDRVYETIHKVFFIAIIVGFITGIVVYIFAASIMSIFVPQAKDVIAMGSLALRFTAVALIPTGIAIMYGGIFQALGNGRYALILAAGQQGIFLIPLVLLLPLAFGLSGIFAASPAAFCLAFLIGIILYTKQKKKLNNLQYNK